MTVQGVFGRPSRHASWVIALVSCLLILSPARGAAASSVECASVNGYVFVRSTNADGRQPGFVVDDTDGVGMWSSYARLGGRSVLGTAMVCSGDGMDSAGGESADWNSDAHKLTGSVGSEECQDTQPKLVWFAQSEEWHAVAADGLLGALERGPNS